MRIFDWLCDEITSLALFISDFDDGDFNNLGDSHSFIEIELSDLFLHEHTSDHSEINPVTGLHMDGGTGGLDISGNPHGTDISTATSINEYEPGGCFSDF